MIPNHQTAKPARKPVLEVVVYFLKLGFLGFGGPLALISSMQRDLIEQRQWMKPDQFARAFAIIKAMPGPIAFQTAVLLGRQRAGWKGGFAAAFGLNGPAFVMMVFFSAYYEQWRLTSGGPEFLGGMQAAALGAILASLKGLASPHRAKSVFWALAVFSAAATFLAPAYEPLLIVSSGALTAFVFSWRRKLSAGALPAWLRDLRLALAPAGLSPLLSGQAEALALAGQAPNFFDLIWNCFKAGAFVFGSGLAIVPLMEHDFVSSLGWLTHREFMDALAFGQITPGPVVITATFIGYRSLGLAGAFGATCAIFAAPFFHMMTWFPRFNDRLARLPWIAAFLTGAIAAVVGSIFATTARMAGALENPVLAIPILLAALAISLFSKIPIWLLIPAGGILHWAASLLAH